MAEVHQTQPPQTLRELTKGIETRLHSVMVELEIIFDRVHGSQPSTAANVVSRNDVSGNGASPVALAVSQSVHAVHDILDRVDNLISDIKSGL